MTGDETASIVIREPSSSLYVTLTADSAVTYTVGNNNNIPIATPYNGGYHVTSDHDIWLFSCNYVRGTQDIATIIPTEALDTDYLVQDYPSWEFGAQVAFVATEDNTVLNMTVPCNIQGTSITAGTTLTPTLQQGQAYLLISNGSGSAFSGMRVTSNGKPFAMFQGGRRVQVPINGSGSDLLYEQALPYHYWGSDFIVPAASHQSGNNYIRITSLEDNCSLSINGTPILTLNSGQTYEHTIPTSTSPRITSTKPICVILYLTSYANGGNIGDPSSVTIPPIPNGINKCIFQVDQTPEIQNTNHYLNIVCATTDNDSMLLDGSPLPANDISNTVDEYTVHRIPIPWTSANQGIHIVENTKGPFIAYAYGIGHYESYSFYLGFTLNPPSQHDTIAYSDTLCQGDDYYGYGFTIEDSETVTAGTLERWRSEAVGDTMHHYHLTLTVLPSSTGDTSVFLPLGDTLFFHGDTLTQAGTFVHYFTGANGCDSIVTIYLDYAEFSLIDTVTINDTICQDGAYNNYGFAVEHTETIIAGGLERWRCDTIGDTLRHYHLILIVLPTVEDSVVQYIILGDTLFFHDDTLIYAGTYHYLFTAANGCDSLLTLYLKYEELSLTTSDDGLCPGDSATLTAHGTHFAWWSSMPYDPGLEAQQGLTTITVSPSQTTLYNLHAYDGGPVLASVTVGVEAPPKPCVSLTRPFIDFDFPVVIFTDCSESSAHSTWRFSDGIIIEQASARRQFHYPLPDSVLVMLQSCSRYNCCSDTSFFVPSLNRSVWFPNVFTPGEETNNRFGITTSFEITKFKLHIYNRQGLLVYYTDDPTALWDGTYDGRPCPQGAYVYHWHVRDTSDYNKSGTGTITLIR